MRRRMRKRMEWLFLGISLKITNSSYRMKSKVTIGVKNTVHYTHSLYILLTMMEIFDTILFVSSLIITTSVQILFIKYKQFLLITLEKTFQLWRRSSISLITVLKNRKNIINLCHFQQDFNMDAEWIFWRITLQNQILCLEKGVATILYQYLATKLLTNSQVRIVSSIWFWQIIDWRNRYKKHQVFSCASCIYDTVWWVSIVTEVNVDEGELKIEFLYPHGPRKTFSWSSAAVLSQHQTFHALSQLQQQSLGECIGSQRLTLNKL